MKRIHWSEIWKKMGQFDDKGKPIPFSISFVKRSTGEIRNIESCALSSIHSKGSTINVLCSGEDKPKKIRKCLIIRFNNLSVYQ